MPTKITTEKQILRLLSNSPLQVEVEFLQMASHVSKNTPQDHLIRFYRTFEEIREGRYDGMIITGAPVEQLPFEEVDYWPELCEIMEWSKRRVYSTLHICWGAQAGLYYHFGVPKHPLQEKMSGIFSHHPIIEEHPLLRGFNDRYWAPHSRHTYTKREDIEKVDCLDILSESEEAGIHIVASHDCRSFFITGHSEYDRNTLADEYFRDLNKGLNPKIPKNYFPGDDPSKTPPVVWRSHANLMFSNWLNFFVYQRTPFDLSEL